MGNMNEESEPLEPPDHFALSAAIGWLGLGCPGDALLELESIAIANQAHPAVLKARWSALAGTRNWDQALQTAEALVAHEPQSSFGWIHRAYTLHELKRTSDAKESLQKVADQFREEFLIPYNMACYAAQLGQLDEARTWLRTAARLAGKKRIKEMATADPDLLPLRDEIAKL